MMSALVVVKIVISGVLFLIAGMAKGYNDGTMFHPHKYSEVEERPNYYDYKQSWKNKWKNGDPNQGEAFWGSSRWFVGLTDNFHKMELIIMHSCVLGAVVLSDLNIWCSVLLWIGLNGARWIGFRIKYK